MIETFMPLRFLFTWPEHRFPLPDGEASSFLDYVGLGKMETEIIGENELLEMDVHILKEVKIGIADFEDWEIIFGGDGIVTTVTAEWMLGQEFRLRLKNIDLTLRLPARWFRRMRHTEQGFEEDVDDHGELQPYDIHLTSIDVEMTIDQDMDVTFDLQLNDDGISLTPFMIGETGIVMQIEQLLFNLTGSGEKPEQAPAGWKGLFINQATVYLPDFMDGHIQANNLGIGTGGFYGRIEGMWDLQYDADADSPEYFTGDLAGKVLGMPGGLSSIALEFVQNVPFESEIEGRILLPFFEEPIDILASIGLDGHLAVSIANTNDQGLFTLKKEDVVEAKVERITFAKEDIWSVSIAGEIRPLIGDIEWPSFEVENLSIDSAGNVHIDGGWIDVPSKKTFNLYGFEAEISQVGFGSGEDESGEQYRWIGLTGDIHLVEGLDTGGSMDGLRLKWWKDGRTALDLKGIGVSFDIPDVLAFEGHVTLLSNGSTGFGGDVLLDLKAAGMKLEASIIIGKTLEEPKHSFCYLYIKGEWPTGIPLGTSGVSLYGMSGLFAHHMEPNKTDDGWYEGWYLKEKPGVTAKDKWTPEYGSLALGAGVNLGTTMDDGYSLSAQTLFAIILPGPIIMFDGHANLLKQPEDVDLIEEEGAEAEGHLRAFAVLDNRAGQFLMNIEASYLFDDKGRVLDLYAGVEAFFDYHQPANWHVYLGQKEPMDKRIRASILQLYQAQTYLMLDQNSVAFGYWQGFDESWKLGPVHVAAAAYAEAEIEASRNPQQFWGHVGLHGSLDVKVFHFGLAMYLDAGISVNAPTPYSLKADLSFGISLPWPFPDIDVDLELKWRESTELPKPLPLKEAAIAHELVQEQQVLKRGEWLLPEYDQDDDGFIDHMPSTHVEPDEDDVPAVALDARPVLIFRKSVKDTSDIGYNQLDVVPDWQEVKFCGDDDEFTDTSYRFSLKDVTLERKRGSSWTNKDSNGQTMPVHGVWLATEDERGLPAQKKLQLWSKSPFEHTKYSTRDLRDAWEEKYPDYPCLPAPEKGMICEDFEQAQMVTSHSWSSERVKVLAFGSQTKLDSLEDHVVITNDHPRVPVYIYIVLPELCGSLSLTYLNENARMFVSVLGEDWEVLHFEEASDHLTVNEGEYALYSYGDSDAAEQRIRGLYLEIHPGKGKYVTSYLCRLMQLCYIPIREYEREQALLAYQSTQQDLVDQAFSEDKVLQPHTFYRLTVETMIEEKKDGEISKETVTEYIYFRTQGPPGYVQFTPHEHADHDHHQNDEEEFEVVQDHPLNTLHKYVKQTIPSDLLLYRAYDVKFAFGTSYVRKMYQMAKKDLSVTILDQNENVYEQFQMNEDKSDAVWEKMIHTLSNEGLLPFLAEPSSCLKWPKQKKVDALTQQSHRLFPPNSTMKALIVPVDRVENFSQFDYAEWKIVRDVTPETNLRDRDHWEIQKETTEEHQTVHYLTQTALIRDKKMVTDTDRIAARGTYCLYQQSWKEMKCTVQMATSKNTGGFGIMFGYQDAGTYYRFSIEHDPACIRVVKMVKHQPDIVYETPYQYPAGQMVTVTIRTDKETMITLDDDQVLTLQETDDFQGKVGLYAWNNANVHFYALRMEDMSAERTVLYERSFQTSRYAHFHHHFHSFNHQMWNTTYTENDETLPATHSDIASSDDHEYMKWYPWPVLPPERLTIEVIRENDTLAAFLLRSPEPVEWERVHVDLAVLIDGFKPRVPEKSKLISWTETDHQPTVHILVREKTSLHGWKIQTLADDHPAAEEDEPPAMNKDELSKWKTVYHFKQETSSPSGTTIQAIVPANLSKEPYSEGKSRRFRLIDRNGHIVHDQYLQWKETEEAVYKNRQNDHISKKLKQIDISVYPSPDRSAAVIVPHHIEEEYSKLVWRWYFRYERKKKHDLTYSVKGNEQDEFVVLDAIYNYES